MFWKKKVKVYYLLNDPIENDVLGVWSKHLGKFTSIVGYSATGALFLHAPSSNEYMVFYPLRIGSNFKNYGSFSSLSEFENTILKEDTFPEYGLYPIDINLLVKLEKKLGKLEENEIYFPALDPALGGGVEPKYFTKGNVWIRSDILGQNRGVE